MSCLHTVQTPPFNVTVKGLTGSRRQTHDLHSIGTVVTAPVWVAPYNGLSTGRERFDIPRGNAAKCSAYRGDSGQATDIGCIRYATFIVRCDGDWNGVSVWGCAQGG